jgi:dihydrodipicolinate synthase/N-acetylneuraminate lyase
MFSQPPRGLIANLVTPVDSGGRLDGASLIELMRRLKKEVSGFLAGGIEAGESLHLAEGPRLDLLAAALEGCGEIPLIFEITSRDDEGALRLMAEAQKRIDAARPEAAVFFLVTPLVYRSNRDLPRHIGRLALTGRGRLIVANDPDLTARVRPGPRHKNIRTAVVKKIGGVEQVAGLAYRGDLTRAINYQRALKDRRGFRFYDASESNFLERPSSSGLISTGALILPSAWADVVRSSLDIFDAQGVFPDRLDRIWRSGRAVREMNGLYRSKPAGFVKKALEMMNLIKSDALLDRSQVLEPDEVRQLTDLLTRLHLT